MYLDALLLPLPLSAFWSCPSLPLALARSLSSRKIDQAPFAERRGLELRDIEKNDGAVAEANGRSASVGFVREGVDVGISGGMLLVLSEVEAAVQYDESDEEELGTVVGNVTGVILDLGIEDTADVGIELRLDRGVELAVRVVVELELELEDPVCAVVEAVLGLELDVKHPHLLFWTADADARAC